MRKSSDLSFLIQKEVLSNTADFSATLQVLRTGTRIVGIMAFLTPLAACTKKEVIASPITTNTVEHVVPHG